MDSPAAETPRVQLSGRWLLVERVVAAALTTFIIYSMLFDYYSTGFGVNNMRVVSFVDSLWHCYCFRVRRVSYFTPQELTSPDKPPRRVRANSTFVYTSARKDLLSSAWILVRALVIKFFAGGVVSLAFGRMPVLLKGPRHITSFLLALTIVQGLPSFTAFVAGGRLYRAFFCASTLLVNMIRGSAALRGAIRLSGALYKMRKLGFLTAACIQARFPWGAWVALAVWSIEFSSVAMTADAMMEGHHPWLVAVRSAVLRSRWRVAAAAALCLVAECVVFGASEFLPPGAPEPWRWLSPFKLAAFALLVVRNFGGFTAVTGYPVLAAVATQCAGPGAESPAASRTAAAGSSSSCGSAAGDGGGSLLMAPAEGAGGVPRPLRRFQPVRIRKRVGDGSGVSGDDTTASAAATALFTDSITHKEEKGETAQRHCSERGSDGGGGGSGGGGGGADVDVGGRPREKFKTE